MNKKNPPKKMVVSREQLFNKINDYLDEHFPKGKSKLRGHALVLIGLATIYGESSK